MRLCFLTPEYPTRPPFGGIATYVQVSARWLTEHGNRVHVLCSSRAGPWGTERDGRIPVTFAPPKRVKPRRLLRYGARLPGLGMLGEAYQGWNRIEDSLGVWLALRQLVQEAAFDLIEVADHAGLGWWGLMWPRRRTPMLVRGHFFTELGPSATEWPGSRFQYWMEKQCAQRADLVLTNSAHLARRYRAECHVPVERVRALPLGFELPKTQPDPVKLLGDCEGNPIVLFVGWVAPQKGIDVLFRAMRLVRAEQPKVRLILAGTVTSRFRSGFEVFLQSAGSWVQHVGAVPQDRIFAMMQRATLVVIPSRTESFGRVAVEAQLCGRPVVASAVGGLLEVVEDGTTGLLVPPEDVDALAGAILQLLNSPSFAAEMGHRARKSAEPRYEVSRVMHQQLEWYQSLTDKYRGSARTGREDTGGLLPRLLGE
jgi:glycosyltransferase involved in cell wall biosynthesis